MSAISIGAPLGEHSRGFAGEAVAVCKVCERRGRNFPLLKLCSNGCCLICHAMYCRPDGHTIDLERARAEYQLRPLPLRSKGQPRQGTVTVEFDGKTYEASYTVGAGVVSVSCAYGSNTAQLRAMTAEGLARRVLGEILEEAKALGGL